MSVDKKLRAEKDLHGVAFAFIVYFACINDFILDLSVGFIPIAGMLIQLPFILGQGVLYTRLHTQTKKVRLMRVAFVACSGATMFPLIGTVLDIIPQDAIIAYFVYRELKKEAAGAHSE